MPHMKLTLSAYAKVNLFLEITGKRPDQYHNICSVMTQVEFCDPIQMENADSAEGSCEQIRLHCSESSLPCDQTNLAWRAADAFLRQTGISMPVSIRIDKRIPMQAGLAGGSSDAAAVLHGMNHLTGNPLSTDELCSIGKTLGADVPFCVRGGTMLCEGIGDEMTRLPAPPDLPIVIAMKPGTGVSTKEAYAQLDSGSFVPVSPQGMLTALANQNPHMLCSELFNRFSETCPGSEPLRNTILSHGAAGALLSGSGAAVFGIFHTGKEAACCADALRAQNVFAVTTRFRF